MEKSTLSENKLFFEIQFKDGQVRGTFRQPCKVNHVAGAQGVCSGAPRSLELLLAELLVLLYSGPFLFSIDDHIVLHCLRFICPDKILYHSKMKQKKKKTITQISK